MRCVDACVSDRGVWRTVISSLLIICGVALLIKSFECTVRVTVICVRLWCCKEVRNTDRCAIKYNYVKESTETWAAADQTLNTIVLSTKTTWHRNSRSTELKLSNGLCQWLHSRECTHTLLADQLKQSPVCTQHVPSAILHTHTRRH